MKIFRNKTWNEYNNQFIDIQIENRCLKEDNETYQEQVKTIVDINKDLSNEIALLETMIIDNKKEIKFLKTLLTKNKISYKRGGNNERRKTKSICEK